MGYRRSSQPNLYLDQRTGIYYVRTKIHGRTIWKSLKTDKFRVAKLRAPKELGDLQKGRIVLAAIEKGSATFGNLAKLYRDRVQTNTRLKPSSKLYRCQTIDAILRFRPGWKERAVRDIRETDCLEWADQYAKEVHGTRFNNSVGSLREIFKLGLENGLISDNPAQRIGKVKVAAKRLSLPDAKSFATILTNIESSGAWCAKDAADLVRFLAYSGCRITEAENIKREDVDLAAGTIRIWGDPVHGTKNSEPRTVPINPAMRGLCERLLKDEHEPRDTKRRGKGYLLKVTEAREALANACAKAEIPKIGHHDCRHLFTTRAIEAQIPIPTVARWLGHKDGGALLMRTYSHLLDAHSKAMAQRMTF